MSAPAAVITSENSTNASTSLAASLPISERIQHIRAVDASVEFPGEHDATLLPNDSVVTVISADGATKARVSRSGLMRFCAMYRLMYEARAALGGGGRSESSASAGDADTNSKSEMMMSEWSLADDITGTSENLGYFASWVNYYTATKNVPAASSSSSSAPAGSASAMPRIPTCATYPIFLGPVDYVVEPADFLFIEDVILKKRGLAQGGVMRLISLGEFCAAIDCGMLKDICASYIAAKIREADEAFIEGVGPDASEVVRSWFGLTGRMNNADFEAAQKKFGAALKGSNWQEHDRKAQAAQKAAGVLPMQPYP